MKTIRFDDLALFARTAALGSFSNAAREAGLLFLSDQAADVFRDPVGARREMTRAPE